ncbi:MAG: DUF6049 family protein, partial [Bifidobacteriaceae bacterium]|nr:DUF6049 family protein [Bifidobacteriaceae bacterium]
PLIQDAGQTPDQAAQGATQTLAAAADLPVDWAFDPALVDQDAAGQDAAGLAAGLADVAAKRGVFALPYGDTDVSQLAHAGVHDTDVLDLAEQRTKAVVKAAFDSTTQGFVHTDLMWPASAADSQLVSMLNRDAHTKYALAPVTATTPAGAWGRPAVATLRVGSYHVTGIIPETQKGVGDAFAAYLASGTLKDRQVLLADLALRGLATQARSTDSTIVLTVPRGLGIGGQDLATRLGTVFGLPWLTAKSLIDVEDSAPESQIYVTSGKDPGRGPSTEVLDKLTGLAARAIPFAQITGNAQAFEAQAAEQLAGPLAVSLPADQRTQKATAAVQQMTATLGQVKIVKGSEVNLIAEAGQVPVVVRNTSAQAVTVQVAFDVADPVIRARKSARIHVAAGEQATAMVPIRAIANGTVQVKATLVNAHGAAVSGATSFAVRVHAEWENIGTLIFAVLVVLLFGFGLVRSIRRRRRERDARADGAAA